MISKAYRYKNAVGKPTRPYIYSYLFEAVLFPYEILRAVSVLSAIYSGESGIEMILSETSKISSEKISESYISTNVSEESFINSEISEESFLTPNLIDQSIIQG